MAVTTKSTKAAKSTTDTKTNAEMITLAKGTSTYIHSDGRMFRAGDVIPFEAQLMRELNPNGVPFFVVISAKEAKAVKAAKEQEAEVEQGTGEIDTGSMALEDAEGNEVGVAV